MDITIPAKQVTVRVQDGNSDPVSDAELVVSNPGIVNENSLNIGGGITNAQGVSSYFSPGVNTDANGDVLVWLIENDANFTYTFTANPPTGSQYLTTVLSNVSIISTVSFTITLQEPVTLSGHVYDPLGNPVPGQTVLLRDQNGNVVVSSETDAVGEYSLEASPNTYKALEIRGISNSSTINVPHRYTLSVANYSLTQDTELDITIPAKQVVVHVRDANNNPIPDAELVITDPGIINESGLTIGGGITNAQGTSAYFAPGISTDSNGDAVVWLLENDSNFRYTITATPPSGSGYQTTVLSNVSIISVVDFTVTLQQPVTLSGHVYDSLGNPVANQTVLVTNQNGNTVASSTTDSGGNYLLEVSAGTYKSLEIKGIDNSPSLNVPQRYFLSVANYVLNQDTVLDITIPAYEVSIHVQDASNNPISGVELTVSNPGIVNENSLNIGGGITNAQGAAQYSSPSVVTDANGDVVLWLLPNDANFSYTLNAIPPSESVYSTTVIQNFSVSGNQSEIISLQFIHDRPVTSAALSPAPNQQGYYSDPTTVTLSATAATGFSIANTYYTVDGGAQQTYSAPFNVTGSGEHTLTYWSVDNVGVPEAPNTLSFTIDLPVPVVTTLIASGDSYLGQGSPNQNHGDDALLSVRSSGKHRTLVQFDDEAIENAIGNGTLISATLQFNIQSNGNNWGSAGRDIAAHRLTQTWTELGATWNCAIDTNTSNSAPNCPSNDWNMNTGDAFVSTPTDSVTITNGLSGTISFDVTSDTQNFLDGLISNYGWIIKKNSESSPGQVGFNSRETSNEPILVLTVQN